MGVVAVVAKAGVIVVEIVVARWVDVVLARVFCTVVHML